MASVLIFSAILLAVFGQLSMKKGMSNVGEIALRQLLGKKISSLLDRFVILGIGLYVLSTAIWLVVLSQEELSLVYPLVGTGYALTAILAKFFFKEKLTVFRISGIVMIIIGAYLIVAKL
jgi:multidrug transporter EmrE-like cation transporter